MRIGHVTSSISRIGAGVSKFVRDLSETQAEHGDAVQIFTLLDQFTHDDKPDNNSIKVSASPVSVLRRFGYSSSLTKTIDDHIGCCDIVHLHGLWMYPNWAAGAVARSAGVPYIMSPHGMLENWSLGRSGWKKKLAGLLFEYQNLARAQCLHSCSEQEYQSLRSFGYKGPVAVIPLGLTRDEFEHASYAETSFRDNLLQMSILANKKVLLFLSRLHIVKGVELLLEAWGAVKSEFPDWHLVIAGDGEASYVIKLKKMAQDAGLDGAVTFTGAVHGERKWALLKNANIFVLPTLSENFGLVVAEALACGTPVITTRGAPWRDLETEQCGWWIEPGAVPLAQCLTDAFSRPSELLAAMGERGRRHVERTYLVDIAAQKMRNVYEWIIAGGESPASVRID